MRITNCDSHEVSKRCEKDGANRLDRRKTVTNHQLGAGGATPALKPAIKRGLPEPELLRTSKPEL